MAILEVKKTGWFGEYILFERTFGLLANGTAHEISARSEDGRQVGGVKFTISGPKATLETIIIDNWDAPKIPPFLLKQFLKYMSEEGAKTVVGEVYDKDNTTPNLLGLFRKQGFEITSCGHTAGYQKYSFSRQI